MRPFIIAGLLVTISLVGSSILIPNPTDIRYVENINNETMFEKDLKYTSRVVSRLATAYHSSVSIVNTKGRSVGSGTIIKRRAGEKLLVLTAYHVIKKMDPNFIIVGVKESKFYRGCKLLRTDPDSDTALLEGLKPETEHGPQARLGKRDPIIGETLWVIGSPKGMERNVTKGILSKILKYKDATVYRTNTDIFFGNSGGGVFNKKGELVGMATAMEVVVLGGHPMVVPGGGICMSLRHMKYILYKK